MKTAIYARVSTRKQDTDNQLQQLRDFASKQGWEVIAEYVDVVSGSGRKERPQFLAMMQDASQHKFDLLLFWSLDRLSREGIVRTLGYLQQFKAWSVGWRSYTQPFLDTGNAMVTDIVLSVLAAVAQQERLTISERTLAGLKRARKAGKVLGRPTATVDMTKVEKRRAKGESLRTIAADLGVSAALLCKRIRAA
jgi:DNA invertase Pin-like site-specific DNA recombinase